MSPAFAHSRHLAAIGCLQFRCKIHHVLQLVRGHIEFIIQKWMAHDVGLHAIKGFVIQPIKQNVNPSFIKHAWVGSQRFLVSYHGVELNMLGDIVLNPPILAICCKCRLPHSFFSGADEGGIVVISKQERFNCKVSTASISSIFEPLVLDIELVIGYNASLDDVSYNTVSSQLAWVKCSCLLQILVRGVLFICLTVKDWCTLSHLIVMRDIF